MKRILTVLITGASLLALPAMAQDTFRAERAQVLRGTLATYSHAPRRADSHIDIPLLIKQLVDVHVNTYSYAIHGNTNDWPDLRAFLPAAREHGIRVWVSIVPPSESPPKSRAYAEPFRLDYDRWAVEFAKLSVEQTNLVAWSIDDFTYNTTSNFTVPHLRKMLDAVHAINPRLAFAPCCYFKPVTAKFLANYEPIVDGLLFPYRHDSAGGNLKESDLVIPEVKKLKAMAGPDFPIIVDVYATAHSKLGASTPQYVREVMTQAHECADGVMVYCHQNPDTETAKYQITKELFTAWSK